MNENIPTSDAPTGHNTDNPRRVVRWVMVAALIVSAAATAWYFHRQSLDRERDAGRERETALAKAVLGEAQRAFDAWDVPLAEQLLEKCPDALLDGAAGNLRARCRRRMKTLHFDDSDPPHNASTPLKMFRWPPQGLIASFSANGEYVAASSTREFVRVWNTATGERVFNCDIAWDPPCSALALSPDGSRLLVAEGKVLREIALPGGNEVWRREGESIYLLNYSPDGKLFAARADKEDEKVVVVFDAAKKEVLFRHQASYGLRDLVFRSDSQWLALVLNLYFPRRFQGSGGAL